MRELLATWLGHLANMRGLLSSPNKAKWIAENVDSVLVTIFTAVSYTHLTLPTICSV